MDTTVHMLQTSPLLRGGHALTRRVHDMFIEHRTQDSELVKRVSTKLSTSPPSKGPLYAAENHSTWQPIGSPLENNYRVPVLGLSPTKLNTNNNCYHTPNMVKNGATVVCPGNQSVDHSEITMLRATITKHEKQLGEMQKTVLRLEEDCVRSQRRVAHVRRKVSHHETVFRDTLNQTQRALQQHADMLVKQQHITQVVLKERRQGEDIMFDTGFLMLSMFIVQTPLVQYTIHIVSSRWIRTTRTHKGWFPRAIQVAYIFHVYHILKYLNIKIGLSSRFWSSTNWISDSLKNISGHLLKIFTHRGTTQNSDGPTKLVESGAIKIEEEGLHSQKMTTGAAVVRGMSLRGHKAQRPNNLTLT